MDDSGILIHVRHLRTAGFCARSARPWFEANGLDWKDFVQNGLPVEVAEQIGDHGGLTAAAVAREEASRG